MLYLYHFVLSECFRIPPFLPILAFTLVGKILASGPRWKGHLPVDSFVIMMIEFEEQARFLQGAGKHWSDLKVCSVVGIIIAINCLHEPWFFGDIPYGSRHVENIPNPVNDNEAIDKPYDSTPTGPGPFNLRHPCNTAPSAGENPPSFVGCTSKQQQRVARSWQSWQSSLSPWNQLTLW